METNPPIVSYDTIFTVATTIIIFSFGIIINRLLKYLENNKTKKKQREHFIFYFEKIRNNLLPQLVTGYKEFYQSTNINTGFPSTPPRLLTGDFKRVINLNTQILLHSFDYQNDIYKIISHIDFIYLCIDGNEYFHQKILVDTGDYRKLLTELIEKYFHSLANYTEFEKTKTKDFEQDKVYILINKSIYKYYNEFAGKSALSNFYYEILRPIQEALVNSNYFRTKEIGKEITSLGKEISHRYNDLKRITTEVRCEYRHIYLILKKTNETLLKYKINPKIKTIKPTEIRHKKTKV